MGSEEQRDWIDHVVARDGLWEPSAQFVDRLSLLAFHALPARQPKPAGIGMRLRTLVDDVTQDLAHRVQGRLWVLRQYRELLLGSG